MNDRGIFMNSASKSQPYRGNEKARTRAGCVASTLSFLWVISFRRNTSALLSLPQKQDTNRQHLGLVVVVVAG